MHILDQKKHNLGQRTIHLKLLRVHLKYKYPYLDTNPPYPYYANALITTILVVLAFSAATSLAAALYQ